MSTDLSYLNTIIDDRRRDTGAGSIDMTTVGFRAINSTLEIWNTLHDWPWTIKSVEFQYNPGIDTYPLDSFTGDFKAPLTLKYYKPFGKTKEFWMVSQLRFDSAYLWSSRFAIQTLAGVQTLRCKTNIGHYASVNTATQYNGSGTWVGDGTTITEVYTDQYEGYSKPSSVAFLFNGTTGTLTNDGNTYLTFQPVDLTIYQNRSNLYFDIYIPSDTDLESFTLKWGTDSSNYYTATMTTDYLGSTFNTGWTRIKVPWSAPATQVGTPTVTTIKYLQLTITCSGSSNLGLFRVQNFFASENIPLLLTYYSTNMVTTTGGEQSQVFQDSSDTTDTPLWSGRWDAATEPFITSVLKIIFFITGETSDYAAVTQEISELIEPLRKHYPSQRRMPSFQIVPDINYQASGDGRHHFGDMYTD